MGLKEYQRKRNFSATAEPSGKKLSRKKKLPLFVVQKHAASHLHYDFRLAMEGVLKSWAVPKGFPVERGDRRLAVQVEDHPIDYADFEGTIPEGNYGAGTVMVWDTGEYEVHSVPPLQAWHEGKLHLSLRGKKLRGEWTLVRTRNGAQDKPHWLLLKSGESIKPFSALTDDRSAMSGRSMAQIAEQNDRQWKSNRSESSTSDLKANARSFRIRQREEPQAMARSADKPSQSSRGNDGNSAVKKLLSKLPKVAPAFVPPMKALLKANLPKGEKWVYELKFDGVRLLALKNRNEVKLYSRAQNDLTEKYRSIASALEKLPVEYCALDGEVVVLDEAGRSSFQLLQSYHLVGLKKPPLKYYVFDLLNLEKVDLRKLPLTQRKSLAEKILATTPEAIRFSPALSGDVTRMVEEMKALGVEGLIAKDAESKYESGSRSGAWVKYKWTHEQEFVIGGFSQPKGARDHFGALLVGFYEGKKLLFAAKVGTGFNQKLLESLSKQFQPLIVDECPFANLPEKLPTARGGGLSRSEMKKCTWLKPNLVCQVRFSEWTRDHHLRQPAFLGLREDKKSTEVIREVPRG